MKLFKNIFTFFLLMFSLPAYASLPIFYSFDGEKIIKVADFPDTSSFQISAGEYVDVGYVYKQIQVLFIPLWNYDGHFVGYLGNKEEYLPLSDDEIKELVTIANITLPTTPSLPFWDAWGGKIIVGIFLLFVIMSSFIKKEDDEKNRKTNES